MVKVIIAVYLCIDGIGMILSGRFLPVLSVIIFLANKNIFKSAFLCRALSIYDWEYFKVKHWVGVDKINSIDILHRKCKISGVEDVEQLPRCNGYKNFKRIKK